MQLACGVILRFAAMDHDGRGKFAADVPCTAVILVTVASKSRVIRIR